MFYQKKTFWIIFIFCCSIIVTRYVKISIDDSGYGKGWYFGDSFSCKNVQSAAMYYHDNGFQSTNYLPMYRYEDTITNNEYIYTHYPPLAEWVGGITTKITGSTSEHVFSFLPMLLSILLIFFIYKVLEDITGTKKESFLSASMIVLSIYFLAWTSDFHQALYIEVGRWSVLWLWWYYLQVNSKKILVPLIALIYACICFISFEAYVYIAIILVGFSWVLQKKVFRWELLCLLLVPAIMFSLRLYINYLHFHTWATTIADFKSAYVTRTGIREGFSELGRKMTWQDYLILLPKTRFIRLGHFYILPSAVLIIICGLGLAEIKKRNKQLFHLCIVVYMACLSWTLLMMQHALIHIFTLRHVAIFVALTIGFGLYKYKEIVLYDFKNKYFFKIAIHSLVILYSITYASINTVYFLYIKYAFCYPHLGVNTYEVDSFFLK